MSDEDIDGDAGLEEADIEAIRTQCLGTVILISEKARVMVAGKEKKSCALKKSVQ